MQKIKSTIRRPTKFSTSWRSDAYLDPIPSTSCQQNVSESENQVWPSPGKILNMVSPIPSLKNNVSSVTKRSRRVAEVLITPQGINSLTKKKKQQKRRIRRSMGLKRRTKIITPRENKQIALRRPVITGIHDDSYNDAQNENECTECGELFAKSRLLNKNGCNVLFAPDDTYTNICVRCGDKTV